MHARPSSRGRFGAEHKDAVPLYMKLGKGRHCKEELLYDAIDCVMEKTDGKGWMVVDRGLDAAKFIHRMKRDRRKIDFATFVFSGI